MAFVTVSELKEHVRVTSDDVEFDRELRRNIDAAQAKVIAYCNRNIFETVADLPAEPAATDMVQDASIQRAIIEVAGYYFDNKGALDPGMIENMLEALVGQYRVESGA